MRIGVSRGLVAAAVIALVCAGYALAAVPVKGGSYTGTYKGESGASISFKVSSNGKKLTGLYVSTPFKCSGGCGGVPAGTAGSAKITKKGTFKTKVNLVGPGATKPIGTDTVVGTFLSHGRAKGTVTSRFSGGSGHKASWTATG
jgi:hypothetical protein